MPDVSRVEYDAALARVRGTMTYGSSRCDLYPCGPLAQVCRCADLTRAALGLDEPPTEEPCSYTCECCEQQTTRPYVHPVEGFDLCAPCVASLPREGDEPPTEACSCTSDADDPNAATERCLKSERACGHHCAHSWSHDRCCWCGMEWGESGEVVPPSEPPKACPTCDGYGGQPGLRGLDRLLHPPCAACNGSGIDGGTAT